MEWENTLEAQEELKAREEASLVRYKAQFQKELAKVQEELETVKAENTAIYKSFSILVQRKLERLRRERGLVEVTLYGCNKSILDLIEKYGGEVGASGYEVWCHNTGTCNHNSHDPGESWVRVYVPQAWIEEAHSASDYEWELRDGDVPSFLVPSALPVLVCTYQDSHWARRTVLVQLRSEAREVL